ncbi:MAG: putative SPBc2 prophage-derived single-strand DNA-specific exonuclease YorK [candidate division WS2 bacterium]|nr:putative SPBc2 prophage-derived single-strand DNA-specific exonuclease YorK [Candidatus Psychracetigena formicireducens]
MDHDNDGICSGIMMYRYLKNFTDHVKWIIFPRGEMHGLEGKEISMTDLLIVVDAGTNDMSECLTLKDRGIDVIIVDHHPVSDFNPHVIIVNNQMGNYPNRTLSGAGVVLKVLEALDEELGTLFHLDYYDLAAIGIIGDMMALDDPETRAIVSYGLETIRNPGVKQILKKQGVDMRNLNTMTISFNLVPVINAATRLNAVEQVLALLLSDDDADIVRLAKICLDFNNSRKVKQKEAIFNLVYDDTRKVILCAGGDFLEGMRGLVANQIANNHKKPTIVVCLNQKTDMYEGSARGYETVSFKSIILSSGAVELAEGHENAFGIHIHKDKLQALMDYCDGILTNEEQVLPYDIELDAGEIGSDTIVQIERFNRITGQGVDPLKTRVNNVLVSERKVSKNKDTITLICETFKAVKFKTTDQFASDIDVFDKIE